ncbi:hypothetical protein [Glutamicibacter sp. X7]
MSKTSKSFKNVEKSLSKLAKKAKTEIPQELRDGWSNAVSGANASAIADAGSKLVDSIGGKSKIAKRSRASIEEAVARAEKSLAGKKKKKGGKFVMLLLVAGAIAAVVAGRKKVAA